MLVVEVVVLVLECYMWEGKVVGMVVVVVGGVVVLWGGVVVF